MSKFQSTIVIFGFLFIFSMINIYFLIESRTAFHKESKSTNILIDNFSEQLRTVKEENKKIILQMSNIGKVLQDLKKKILQIESERITSKISTSNTIVNSQPTLRSLNLDLRESDHWWRNNRTLSENYLLVIAIPTIAR